MGDPATIFHLLEREGISDCSCPYEWRGLGVLYGVSFGKGWVRMKDDSRCPHHGEKKATDDPA
jgi:hypothetical protein